MHRRGSSTLQLRLPEPATRCWHALSRLGHVAMVCLLRCGAPWAAAAVAPGQKRLANVGCPDSGAAVVVVGRCVWLYMPRAQVALRIHDTRQGTVHTERQLVVCVCMCKPCPAMCMPCTARPGRSTARHGCSRHGPPLPCRARAMRPPAMLGNGMTRKPSERASCFPCEPMAKGCGRACYAEHVSACHMLLRWGWWRGRRVTCCQGCSGGIDQEQPRRLAACCRTSMLACGGASTWRPCSLCASFYCASLA
jgi:hypothetical protein